MTDRIIIVNDLMQKDYRYVLSEPEGLNFDPEFKPELTPPEMLKLGIFGGKYMTDCRDEFPESWFIDAKLCHEKHRSELNYFGINASKSLAYWRERGYGYMSKILAVGSNGTADIIGGEEVPMICARSDAGRQWSGM